MKYEKLCSEILEHIGGASNIQSAGHCVTRLRLTIKDETKVNASELKKIDGVLDVINAGQLQIVIGNTISDVYKDFEIIANIKEDETNEDEIVKQKGLKAGIMRFLDFFIACFTPVIPVVAGSGMIKVICTILVTTNILTTESHTYLILAAIGEAVFYFLPVFIGYTAAKRLNTDPFLGMLLALIVLSPNYLALSVDGATTTSFMGITVQLVDYSAQALPVILGVWMLKYVNGFFDKYTPNVIKVFARPMMSLLIVVPVLLIIFGPISIYVAIGFQSFVNIMNHWGLLAVGLNAAIFPFIVLTGLHNALIPLIITMFASQGFDAVLVPSGLIANISMAGAAAAIYVKTTNSKSKGVALSATVSALLGITEPALYGILLKHKKAFISMIIGAFVAGCVAGLLNLTAYSFVSPSILSLPIFIGENSNLITAIICTLTAFVITFIVTFLFTQKQGGSNE